MIMLLPFSHNALTAFAFILLALLACSAAAEDEVKVDYMSLTALMIKEGDYVRAGEAIEKVDRKDEKLDVKGKKLIFISQEIGREINTMGAKAQYAPIQQLVVSMKDDLERIKEQLLNVL